MRHSHLDCDFVLGEKQKTKKKKQRVREQTETKREHSAPFAPWLWSLGKCNGVPRRLDAVQGEKMCAQACVCVFHGRVTKLREEMGRDKNRGLTQAELSDWIKRSAWQPGRLALAHCSCHPLATHLAHKTLAQLVGPGYSLHASQATCGSQALYLHLPKIFPNCQI